MNHDSYPDSYIRRILERTRTIAMVGASPTWNRPSFFAMKYLQEKGYRVIPVNTRVAGSEILGERVYGSLEEIPQPYDMVDIFRHSKDVPPIVDQTLALAGDRGIKVVWMQLGVRHDEAAARVEQAGLKVVMDRCAKIEYGRLNTELSWGGFNSRVISSKRRRLRIG